MVQWLGLYTSTAGGTGLIPGWGTKIPPAMWHNQKIIVIITISYSNGARTPTVRQASH